MTITAEFRQPRKQLNPLDVKIGGAIAVELYHVGRRPIMWKARIVGGRTIPLAGSKTDLQFPETSGGVSMLKAAIDDLFDEQLTPWVEHMTDEERKERDEPAINKKPVKRPRDLYGMKGPGV